MSDVISITDKMRDLQEYNNLLLENLNLRAEYELLKETNMKNQFFYTRKEKINQVDHANSTETPTFVNRKDSFNLNHVVRSIEMHDGSVLVLLDDIHERTTETPNINTKNNKVSGTTRKRDTYQSEIYLSPEDGERFYKVTATDYLEGSVIHKESSMERAIEIMANDGDTKTIGA
jgi:hypothetical protein